MNCVYCSKVFVDKKDKKFCSKSCRNSHYRMRKKLARLLMISNLTQGASS